MGGMIVPWKIIKFKRLLICLNKVTTKRAIIITINRIIFQENYYDSINENKSKFIF